MDSSQYDQVTLPSNVTAVEVEKYVETGGYWVTREFIVLYKIWREVTSQEEIEKQLIAQNKRHLQQTAREEGITTNKVFEKITQTTDSMKKQKRSYEENTLHQISHQRWMHG